jgi:hypothetical protein
LCGAWTALPENYPGKIDKSPAVTNLLVEAPLPLDRSGVECGAFLFLFLFLLL